jgi:hypothetical protein
MSRFKTLMIAVAVIAMAVPSFAAVENIKVGGDITTYGIQRMFDVSEEEDPQAMTFFQTHVRVYVHASLTDNVEAMVRLINERYWGTYKDADDANQDGGYEFKIAKEGEATVIDLDLAYIKVSDLGVPGLGLTVGRQEIQFGEGLVVGSAYMPYTGYPEKEEYLKQWAQDLGMQKAFDAVRVDYAGDVPVDATLFMAKIIENPPKGRDEDYNLYGLNLGFKIQDIARLEGYYVRLQDMWEDPDEGVTTVGVRATGDFAGLGLKGEYAKQLGEWDDEDNAGWAFLLGGKYEFPTEMSASVHANLSLFSGDDGDSKKNTEWITFFPSNDASRLGPLTYALILDRWGPDRLANKQVINVGGSVRPVEKICIGFDWFNIKLREEFSDETGFGNEIDASVTYNYTEDLSFGLQYGLLMRGDFLTDGLGWDNDPWQLIASAKLAF